MPHGGSDSDGIDLRLNAILRARAYPKDSRYLLALLEDVQMELGCVPDQVLAGIARYFGLTKREVRPWLADPTVLRSQPLARHVLKVCNGPVCRKHGGPRLMRSAGSALSGKDDFSLIASQCLGRCDEAPAVMLDDSVQAPASPVSLRDLLHDLLRADGGVK